LALLRFELRDPYFLGKHSISPARLPGLFALVILEISLFAQTSLDHTLILVVARMTGVHCQPQGFGFLFFC
jgi:hypothetical protein